MWEFCYLIIYWFIKLTDWKTINLIYNRFFATQSRGIPEKRNPGPYEYPGSYEDPGPQVEPGPYDDQGPYKDAGPYEDPKLVLSLLLNTVFG